MRAEPGALAARAEPGAPVARAKPSALAARAAGERRFTGTLPRVLTFVAGALPLLSLASVSLTPAAALAGPPTAPTASSPAPVTLAVEMMVLHATNVGGGIDSRVGNLAQLKKPPFSTYDTYKLLTQSRTPLVQGAETPVALPDGGKVRLTLKQTMAPGRGKMSVSIQKPDGSVFLPLAELTTGTDGPFFVGGYRHKTGILVIGFKLVG
ncbi:MAG TPA: hypothetical protein VFS00_24575 [Polyangiaceae bacterium]|nr:hypothetical protein [Polyangiaceae bacterium]